ncbi:MAG: sulfurtransferase-like selenium metabolism protein YedF [Treponema sp.]|nr:sulfurtransferase-like selenium metabolism protein YedF [Treponema sp.]
MITLDMRGQPCPIPVVNAKKALAVQEVTGVVVIVDNIVAVQNLEKMAKGTGCAFSYTGAGTEFRVTITKGPGFKADVQPVQSADAGGSESPGQGSRGPLMLITADSMGRGDDPATAAGGVVLTTYGFPPGELGKILIKGFIFSLTQLDPPPEAIVFLNSGVRLTVEGANTVGDLKTLEDNGTKVYICGTCANYYNLSDKIGVGSIVDMMFITNQLAKASKIITI